MPAAQHAVAFLHDTTANKGEVYDLMVTLHACMLRLDALGASVAAAHLDECIQHFAKGFILDEPFNHSE